MKIEDLEQAENRYANIVQGYNRISFLYSFKIKKYES